MRGAGTVKIDGRKLLAFYATATSVVADEVCLVSVNRLHREGQGWAFSDEASSRTVRWAHLLLTEALTTLQADLMHRQPRAGVAAAGSHTPRPEPTPAGPAQVAADRAFVVPLDVTGRDTTVIK